jgi:hypothetical protein
MTDKYHYDSNGKYTGKSSDDPPGSPILGAIVLFFIVAGVISMCSSNKTGSNASKAPVTNSSNKDPGSKWTVPDEDATAKKPQWTVPNETQQEPQTQQIINSTTPQSEPAKQWTVPKED